MTENIRRKYQKLPAAIRSVIIRFINLFNKTGFYLLRLFRKGNTGVYSKDILNEYNVQRPFGPRPVICYAPYVSMFFSVFGKVSPCYATYPKLRSAWNGRSIRELWESEDFRKIRQQVKSNDLSDHCSFCHVPLNNKNYGSMLARKYDHYPFHDKNYPGIMEFELENTCNLQCVMCNGFLSSSIRQNREKNRALPKQYDERFVRQLEEFIPHLKVAEFTGGDPFLINIYYEIWDKISEMNPNCNILITTNANTYNEKTSKLLNKIKNISFNISIDSLKKETYEKIRVGGNFEKAMENISVFHNYCRSNSTTLNFLICPLQLNWKEFPDFINYGNKNGIPIFFHMVIKPENLALWSMASGELKHISEYLNAFEFSANNETEKQNRENYLHLARLVETWHNKAIEREQSENYKFTKVNTTEKEMVFIHSVLDFVKNNIARESPDNRCLVLEQKIKRVFSELPDDFDKDQFLNHLLAIPVDDYIVTSMEDTDEITLKELIMNWVFYE